MKNLFALLSVLAMVGAAPGAAEAWPVQHQQQSAESPILRVADTCYAVGQRLAERRGARLLRADAVGGNQCRVVMLVPDGKGGRPRREETVVPMR
ncbi:hypothetical protein [Notoacmeibacter sp. MSK16QG-6]|uniref:hypothetical protein n=1 Tax=Notoacmeibacter sp. MSK16QG-6 TaxID=2957982 RepID=UPI0020A0F98A|nr:hypothetical protein [Notoacmeibacter sp. MSK16QG-6]MCP1198122.1 hypothetical protein [Notoacmeibacter sp. MSK16QG-6]